MKIYEDKYMEMFLATKDLLKELRIDDKALKCMALGFSPDAPDAPGYELSSYTPKPSHRVLLSQKLAKKLVKSLELE